MHKIDTEILALFKRYLHWLQSNQLDTTMDNFKIYVTDIEKFDFSKF